MRTGSHLKIESFGSAVLGVRLLGNPKLPEPDEFRVSFPGGDISIARLDDGSYWAHIRVEHAKNDFRAGNEPSYHVGQGRMDCYGKHSSECDLGETNNPDLYHVAIKIKRDA